MRVWIFPIAVLLALLTAIANGQARTIRAEQIEDAYLRNDQDDTTTGRLTVNGGLHSNDEVRILGGNPLVLDASGLVYSVIPDASGLVMNSTRSIRLRLGDTAGTRYFSVEDSAGSPLLTLDSNALLSLYGDIELAQTSALLHPAGFRRYLGLAQVVRGQPNITSSNDYIFAEALNDPVIFQIDTDSESYGGDLVLDQITVYGRTNTASAYVTSIELVTSDPASGAHTARVTHSTDYGNGSTGLFGAAILVSDAGPYDALWYLVIETTGMTGNADIIIHSVQVDYHRE